MPCAGCEKEGPASRRLRASLRGHACAWLAQFLPASRCSVMPVTMSSSPTTLTGTAGFSAAAAEFKHPKHMLGKEVMPEMAEAIKQAGGEENCYAASALRVYLRTWVAMHPTKVATVPSMAGAPKSAAECSKTYSEAESLRLRLNFTCGSFKANFQH